jgi:hypothetical protein
VLHISTAQQTTPRPSAQAIKAKRREIAIRWRSRRSRFDVDKMIAGIRRREIEDLIRYRHGRLPDTDDRSIYLRLWAWHNPRSRRQELELQALQAMCCRVGASIPETEILATIRYVQRRDLRRFAADTLGKHLMLTELERDTLGITTIEAHDVSRGERNQLRAQRNAERLRKWRRKQGVKSRAEYEQQSLSKLKPWEQENMSRSTWYARRKSGQKTPLDKSETEHLPSSSAAFQTCPTKARPIVRQHNGRRGAEPLSERSLSLEHLGVEMKVRRLCSRGAPAGLR